MSVGSLVFALPMPEIRSLGLIGTFLESTLTLARRAFCDSVLSVMLLGGCLYEAFLSVNVFISLIPMMDDRYELSLEDSHSLKYMREQGNSGAAQESRESDRASRQGFATIAARSSQLGSGFWILEGLCSRSR